MKRQFDLLDLSKSAGEIASLTEDTVVAFAAYKKAKGCRVNSRPFPIAPDHPSNEEWREREFHYVIEYHKLRAKAEILGDLVTSFGVALEVVQQSMTFTLPYEKPLLAEYFYSLRKAARLCLDFDRIDAPDSPGFDAAVSSLLSARRQFSISRSIGFLPLEPMRPAIPLTWDEAVQHAKEWISTTVTGNAQIISLESGNTVECRDLPLPRQPMSVDQALRLAGDDRQPDKKLYATISLIHHAPAQPTGGFDSSPCSRGRKIELDFVAANSRKLCRCGANIRLGCGSSGEDWYPGCCSGTF